MMKPDLRRPRLRSPSLDSLAESPPSVLETLDAIRPMGNRASVDQAVSTCSRCDTMRALADRLASDRRDRISVRRVGPRPNPQSFGKLNLNACPSDVAFRGGQEAFETQTSAFRSSLPGRLLVVGHTGRRVAGRHPREREAAGRHRHAVQRAVRRLPPRDRLHRNRDRPSGDRVAFLESAYAPTKK